MRKNALPNTDYFKPVLLVDPTFGNSFPVFLLRTDANNAFYTTISVFFALKKADALDKVINSTLFSPYRKDVISFVESNPEKPFFFCDSIDVNWFYFEDCSFYFAEEQLEIKPLFKGYKQSLSRLHFTLPEALTHPEIIEHLPLLHLFGAYFFSDDLSPWKRELDFVADFSNHKLDLFHLFRSDALFYLHLYSIHFAKPNELHDLLFKTLFSSTIEEQRISQALQEYNKLYIA